MFIGMRSKFASVATQSVAFVLNPKISTPLAAWRFWDGEGVNSLLPRSQSHERTGTLHIGEFLSMQQK